MQPDGSPLLKEITYLPIEELREASWNPNHMEPKLMEKLKYSLRRFGLVGLLVVRPLVEGKYEVLSGNQRLQVLGELGVDSIPCAVVDLPDAEAKLLGQTLNSLHGSDDLGIRAELLNEVLAAIPESEVLALLPGAASSLQGLGSLSQEDLAEQLQSWQLAQSSKLRTFPARLTPEQHRVVEAAINKFLPQASREEHGSPNLRGTALYLICKEVMNREETT